MPKKILLSDGTENELTEKHTELLLGFQSNWAKEGKRVLLLARRVILAYETPANSNAGTLSFSTWATSMNVDLVVVGMIAIVDPPRPESAETVRIFREAGVRFFMVTGDLPMTAAAIAHDIEVKAYIPKTFDKAYVHDPEQSSSRTLGGEKEDIGSDKHKALLLFGSDMITLNDSQWEQVCQYEEIVFARTLPDQKLRIIKEFQKRDYVVAMTGDGVNNVPSLKTANVGVAMGGGSDVAMEAADMVLLDQFSSIIVAIESGRLVFDNLKKLLLPAGSWSELWPVLVNIFFGCPQTLSSFPMIIICVLTDLFPSLALMMEKPEAGLLNRPPRRPKKDRLGDTELLLHSYGFVGIIEMVSSMLLFFLYMSEQGIPPSAIFLSFSNLNNPDGYMGFTADQIIRFINTAQSVYFVNLVDLSMGQSISNSYKTFIDHSN